MKTKALILAVLLVSCAGGFSQESASTNHFEIVWSVPTNHVPSSVWVYKFVPQTFAPIVISNLMAMGSFTSADQTNIENQPPFKDTRLMYFKNNNWGKRELGIFPPVGYIYFHDFTAEAKGHAIAVGVPSDEEAYQLGLDYIQKLGIDRSQLATKADGSELRIVKTIEKGGWFDKASGTNFEQNYKRGIYFIRRVNGIDLDGMVHGGINFEFGNQGKIFRLEILWKGLEPYELHPTLSAEQLAEQLRLDKGKWHPFKPLLAKKITIREAKAFYRGFSEDGEEHKFLEPYIQLEANVETGTTNFVSSFDCSLFAPNH